MVAEKSMDAIITKKDDAKSIIKELVDELDERSLADGTLVVRADVENVGTLPVPDMRFEGCWPQPDTYNQDCVDRVFATNVPQCRRWHTCKITASSQIRYLCRLLSWYGDRHLLRRLQWLVKKWKRWFLRVYSRKKFLYEGIDSDQVIM
jgi:hypothetical protein